MNRIEAQRQLFRNIRYMEETRAVLPKSPLLLRIVEPLN
jgi:hypothetical protein